MTQEERLQKVMRKIDSAITHMEKLTDECFEEDMFYIMGHLRNAREKVHNLHYAKHHKGKKIVQNELF